MGIFDKMIHMMFGDCGVCGHSFVYHIPMVGCIKLCGCGEFC